MCLPSWTKKLKFYIKQLVLFLQETTDSDSLIRPWGSPSSQLASIWFSPAHRRKLTRRCRSTALVAQCPAMPQQESNQLNNALMNRYSE
jgi:hypothetical protein